MTPYLLPIRVTACAVDKAQPDAAWAFRMPDYEAAHARLQPVWPPETGATERRPPAKQQAVSVAWSVPPGWSRELPLRDDAPDELPRLPDRWLVVRVARRTHDANGRVDVAPGVKVRIIDAGVASPDGARVIATRDGKPTVERVGVVRDLVAARVAPADESREPLDVHGAAGSRDLTFAAHVPANLNNLSYIDDLADVPDLADTALTYFVAGWYRQPTLHDPLQVLRERRADAPAIRRALGLFDPPLPADDREQQQRVARELQRPLAERCLFHGMVAHIDYFNPRSYLGPTVGGKHPEGRATRHACVCNARPTLPDVGVGPTAEAALAELWAADGAGSERREAAHVELLEAVLQDTLRTYGELGGADLRAHATRLAGFQAIASGQRWSVGPSDGVAPPQRAIVLDDASDTALTALNDAEAAADAVAWELATAVETLAAVLWIDRQRQLTATNAPNLADFITRQADRTDALRRKHTDLHTAAADARSTLAEALAAALRAGHVPVALTTRAHDTPPFYLPREPAIAVRNISGQQPARPLARAGRPGHAVATAGARLHGAAAPSAALAPISAALPGASGDPHFDPVLLALTRDADLGPVLLALADEAARVEATIAALVGATDATDYDASTAVSAWVARGVKLWRALGGAAAWPAGDTGGLTLPHTDLHFECGPQHRVALADLVTLWTQQPWLPVFLDWSFVWRDAAASESACRGRTLLAYRPQQLLPDRLARTRSAPVSGLAPDINKRLHDRELDRVAAWDLVGQSLGGFHQQVLGRDDGFPRLGFAADDATAIGRCAALLNAADLGPPHTTWRGEGDPKRAPLTFHAERVGALRLESLRVVDLFGQALALDPPDIKGRGRSLDPTRPPPGPDEIPLDRRLLEPTRFLIEIPADGVHGWIVASRLDRAIIVYTGDGAPLGLVTTDGPNWIPLRSDSPATAATIADPVLARFVAPLLEREALDAFLALAHHALARTLPARAADVASPAALVGRPLALVEASLRFERRGGPILNPQLFSSPRAFREFSKDPDAYLDIVRPATSVRVTLGCRHLPDDGVLCFQRDGGAFASTAKLSPQTATIELRLPAGEQPAACPLTVLMDPHGKLYVDPTLLPVAACSLPERALAVLARLPAVVRVDPVLVDPGRVELPLPPARRGDAATAPPGGQLKLADGVVDVAPATPTATVPRALVAVAGALIV